MSKIKKTRSAYNFYVKRWKTMSPDERAPFNQKAVEDKKRHDKEVYLEKKKNGSFNEEAGNYLFSAASEGDIKRAADALRQGADINYTDPVGDYDRLGMRMGVLEMANEAGNTSMVRFLLNQPGIDVNLESDYSTPLISAVQVGGVDCVRLLLDMSEIDVNKQVRGKTPLMWSAILGHVDEVRLLLAHPNIAANIRDDKGRTALSWTEEPDDEFYKDEGVRNWLEEELERELDYEGGLGYSFDVNYNGEYNDETLEKNRAICHDLIESFLVESRLVLNRVFKKKNIGSGVAHRVGNIVSKRIHGLKPTTTPIVF